MGGGSIYKVINGLYFSPTNNTKDAVHRILKDISTKLKIETMNFYDFTLVSSRKVKLEFDQNDVVVIGVPVYAGRVPNLLLNYLKSIVTSGALCIPVVTFGNRDFDDALIELATIMEKSGFRVISAGAFVYPHSFSNRLASDRPDERDLMTISNFSEQSAINIRGIIQNKLDKPDMKYESSVKTFSISAIKGEVPYRDYFKPVDKNGYVFEFRKIKPNTSNKCMKCNICVDLCPMGSIEKSNPQVINGKCIKCCACIKSCPINAKEFTDENYIKHKIELEELKDIRQEAYICY
ncbi:MAG: EFR1 family ferrodoxin [Acidaminobacteraceae bacterium]